MTHNARRSATSGSRTLPLVAGLNRLTASERDADRIAHTVSAALAVRGGSGITVATHWARVGDLRHVALSVESTGLTPAVFSDVLATATHPEEGDHPDAQPVPGCLLSDRYTGPPELRSSTETAVAAHLARSSGRVVVFPGSELLSGTISVGRVLAMSALNRVDVLAGGEAAPDVLLVTRDFVRARWTAGELVLDTQPAAGGTLVPFETPFPTPCCVHHT